MALSMTAGGAGQVAAGAGGAYAVIVSYQCRQHLAYSVQSLLDTEQPDGLRVVVVDNGSTDGTAEYVATAFPSVTVLRLRRNRGFTGGANAGLRYALRQDATLIGLFNADIRIHPAWLRAASAVLAADPRIGCVGFEQIGGLRSGAAPPDRWPIIDRVAARPRTSVSGACLCIAPRALRHVGLFDRGFRTFSEETDLYLRLQRAGFSLLEVSVPSWHLNGGYWSRRPLLGTYRLMRSLLRYGIKHWPASQFWPRFARLARLCCSADRKLDLSYRFHLMLRDQPAAVRLLIFAAAAAANVAGLPRTLLARRRCSAVPRWEPEHLAVSR